MNDKKFDEVFPALILESKYLSMSAQLTLWNIYQYGINGGPGRYNSSLYSFIEEMANEGNSRFEYYLGMIYLEGLGKDKNQSLAEKWLVQADIPEGKTQLAVAWLSKNEKIIQAEKMLLDAESDDPEASFQLGLFYAKQGKYLFTKLQINTHIKMHNSI